MFSLTIDSVVVFRYRNEINHLNCTGYTVTDRGLTHRVDPGIPVQMGIFVCIYLVLCCHGKNNVNPNMKISIGFVETNTIGKPLSTTANFDVLPAVVQQM